MAKRFIDTGIFRDALVRSLDAPYKLLWMYLFCECNHAGIFDVELDVAGVRLGFQYKREDVLKAFHGKVVELGEDKWFIPSFVEFQYGKLNPANRAHKSVLDCLESNGVKVLGSPLQGAMDKDKDMDMDKDKEGGVGETKKSWFHGEPPVTLEQAKSFAPQAGVTPECAERWWYARDKKNWEGVNKWQSDLKSFSLVSQDIAARNGKPDKKEPTPPKKSKAPAFEIWSPIWDQHCSQFGDEKPKSWDMMPGWAKSKIRPYLP